jgi:ABC-type bacteriocin/lantibiotic exporter with double-glycine peptidase domain
MLDLAGLSLIAPYISLVMNPANAGTGVLGELFHKLGLDTTPESMLLSLGCGLVLIFLGKMFGNLWIHYRITNFCEHQQFRLRYFLMQAYQGMPYQIYLSRNSSEYVHSVQILVGKYGNILSILLKTVSDILIAGAIILLLAWQNIWILCTLLALLGGLIVIYDRVFRNRLRGYGRQTNEAHHQVVQSIHEALEGFKELRILGKETYFQSRLKQGAKSIAYYSIRHQLLNLAPGYLLEFLLVAFVVLVLSISVWLEQEFTSVLPVMGVFGVAALRLKPTANSLVSSLITLRFERDSVTRLVKDIKFVDSCQASESAGHSEPEQVPFENLSVAGIQFFYPSMAQPALKDVSMQIRKGETIGLIGPSGSGKTTLVDVLLGLLEPQSGKIEFNGQSLQDKLGRWRSQVAYLPQQIFLVDNSLRCNVALGEEESEIDEFRLLEALHQARLSELVEQLPQGANTILGERGVRLSGGQRQRVALARAFYHKRSVLVMDEATSALDNETEKEIVEEILRLQGQKTMIVVAHRLTTVQHCDRIYRLDHGKIVEEGTPEQVLKRAG